MDNGSSGNLEVMPEDDEPGCVLHMKLCPKGVEHQQGRDRLVKNDRVVMPR